MLGIERGNIDVLNFALVGGAALIAGEYRSVRMAWATVLVGLGVLLKLYPLFCVALVARFSRRTLIFAAIVTAISLVYFIAISDYLPILWRSAPRPYFWAYGYKTAFMGFDRLL